jgi:two-component system chemotaxis response regulator CheB
MSIRVLVVDDSAMFRRITSRALESLPGVQIAGICQNGRLALDRMQADPPDLIMLDMEMPEMNGLDTLKAMRRLGLDTPVIVLSAVGDRDRELTVRALELGAFDFLAKPERSSPEENLEALRGQLAPLVAAVGHRVQVRSLLRGDRPAPKALAVSPLVAPAPVVVPRGQNGGDTVARMQRLAGHVRPDMVLIGVSTGGPIALAQVIPQLRGDLRIPVIVVQHMPPLFTKNLADNLRGRSALRVKEAEDAEVALPGCVYIAQGGSHLKVTAGDRGEILLRITNDPPENNCRPAVDYLFRSAADSFPGRSMAVILTGMGSDGAEGLRRLKAGGCFALAQDEASCVVFGMPRAAMQTGLVDLVAPLGSIAAEIAKAVK